MARRTFNADTCADIVLLTGGLAGALIFIFLGSSYTLTDRQSFHSLLRVALSLGLPAMGAVLSFAALRLPSSSKINVVLSMLSISVAVYAAELLLGVSMSLGSASEETLWGMGRFSAAQQEDISAFAKRAGRDFDLRTRAEVVRELRQQGISAVPSLIPQHLLKQQADGTFRSELHAGGAEILPVSGISNSVTVLCNETGRYALYDSDEHGFHNPKGLWASGQVAIAALGDSFTAGACVPSNTYFVALIRNHYPATVNLGMLGQGPLIQLAALKEYLPFVKPQVVLWAFFEGNDLGDLQTESKHPLLRNYLKKHFTQSLFYRQPEIDQLLTAYVEQALETGLAKHNERQGTSASLKTLEEIITLSHVRHKLGAVYGRLVQPSPHGEDDADSTAPVDVYRAILVEATASIRTWGGTLYFIYLPSRDTYVNQESDQRESMLAMVRELNLPVIDIAASFQKQSDPLSLFPFRRFGHYNEEGNQVVAEAILRAIAAQ